MDYSYFQPDVSQVPMVQSLKMLYINIPRQIGQSHSLDRVDSLKAFSEINQALMNTLKYEFIIW